LLDLFLIRLYCCRAAGGLRELAAQLAGAVPKQALARLPPRTALQLRALGQRLRSGELPTTAVADAA
jgi:hypothetical protein